MGIPLSPFHRITNTYRFSARTRLAYVTIATADARANVVGKALDKFLLPMKAFRDSVVLGEPRI
ncbi:MAG TPA: hypothetical protein DHW77_09160 [Verrucomicrobiales bacterium]|jgi:hypothetical protein|nr:hypothetical protein [Verrucomicrobiales bacterium]HCL97920.1 hypothetical protein [Verrucomicrobiales bacterium]